MTLARAVYPHPFEGVPMRLRDAAGSFASATANGIYVGYPGNLILSTAAASAIAVMRLDPSHFGSIPAYKKSLVVRGRVETNDVAPGNVTFNFNLWTVTGVSGATGTGPKLAVGSVVAGSTFNTIVNPAADSMSSGHSSFFDFPAAGWYAVGCQLQNGPTVAGSNLQLQTILDFAYLPVA